MIPFELSVSQLANDISVYKLSNKEVPCTKNLALNLHLKNAQHMDVDFLITCLI